MTGCSQGVEGTGFTGALRAADRRWLRQPPMFYIRTIFCSKPRKNISSFFRAVKRMYHKLKGSSVAIWYISYKVLIG